MKTNHSFINIVLLVCVFLFIIIGMTWGNFYYANQNSGKNDFIPRWVGTHSYLTKGISPYSNQVVIETQKLVYGRVAHGEEDSLLFFYPFHVIFVYAPFAIVGDPTWARAIWMTVLEGSIVLITILGLLLSRWRKQKLLGVLTFLLALTWFFSVQPLLDGNLSIICALGVVGALFALRSKKDVLAGFLLALGVFKPQMVILLIVFVVIWAASKRRWLVVWSFLGSSLLVIALATLLFPDWIMDYLRQIFPYIENPQWTTTFSIFSSWLPGVGMQLGWLLTGVMTVLLFVEWKAALGKGFNWFLWTSYLTLIVTVLIGIPSATVNFIVFLPAIILVVVEIGSKWGNFGKSISFILVLMLTLGIWAMYGYINDGIFPLVQYPWMFILLPIILLFLLYWIRWWAIKKSRLPLQELSNHLQV